MKTDPLVSVVTGSYNRRKLLKPAIESIRAELEGIPHEIIVVDGGSDDGALEWLIRQKDILTIVQHNRGEWEGKLIKRRSWGYFMNLGFKSAKGKYVCMLSDDCLVVPGAIKNGVELFERSLKEGKKIGAVAFYWRNWPEEKKYRVGVAFGDYMFVNHGLFLKDALESVDYADEDNYFFYHADTDLCLRMTEKGYGCIDAPNSFVEHHSHANTEVRSSNSIRQKNDWDFYVKKWSRFGKPRKDRIEREFEDRDKVAERYWRRRFWEFLRAHFL